MSSQQRTPDAARTDAPESAPGIDDVPNFNREGGEERTELGASLNQLCKQAREARKIKRLRQTSLEDYK